MLVLKRFHLLTIMLLLCGFAAVVNKTVSADPGGKVRKRQDNAPRQTKQLGHSEKKQANSLVPVKIALAPGHTGLIYPVDISPDGKTVAYQLRSIAKKGPQDYERSIFLCDVETGKEIQRISVPKEEHPTVTLFSPDGKTLITRDSLGKICLWDWRAGKCVRQWDGWIWPDGNAFSAGGKLLVGYDKKGSVIWEVATGKVVCHFEAQKFQNVTALAFSGDSKMLVTEHYRKRFLAKQWPKGIPERWEAIYTVHLWKVGNGKHLGQVGPELKTIKYLHSKDADGEKVRQAGGEVGFHARFSPEGKIVLFPPRHKPRGIVPKHAFRWMTPNEHAAVPLLKLLKWDGQLSVISLAANGKMIIATGYSTDEAPKSTLLILDISKFKDKERRTTPSVSVAKVGALWMDLTEQDASKAHSATRTLAANPVETLAFLQGRVHPVPSSDPKIVKVLLKQLDDQQFAVRARAERALLARAEPIVPVLRLALKGQLSVQVRRRVEKIVKTLDPGRAPGPETFRGLWTVEILEQLGSVEAQRLLKKLAQGASAAWVTQEAKASLVRLAKRSAAKR
jgi:dipeptidyl aminopeptidase/acylaminoacyl peptidase